MKSSTTQVAAVLIGVSVTLMFCWLLLSRLFGIENFGETFQPALPLGIVHCWTT